MIDRLRRNLFETIECYQHDLDFEAHSEPAPTGAKPGSLEKIQVMCQRLANGEELHHPNDERTCASMELQHQMTAAVIELGQMHRDACRVKREHAQPKRESSLYAARVTKQRIYEAKQAKKRTTQG
jgi:hypothetical protein